MSCLHHKHSLKYMSTVCTILLRNIVPFFWVFLKYLLNTSPKQINYIRMPNLIIREKRWIMFFKPSFTTFIWNNALLPKTKLYWVSLTFYLEALFSKTFIIPIAFFKNYPCISAFIVSELVMGKFPVLKKSRMLFFTYLTVTAML